MRNEATIRQIEAANPLASTWVSANAGSGKTRVLTDRVARLLLDGVDPRNILCLTYTTAAASEMQNRLFKRLGEWAMMSDAELARSLTEMGADQDLTGETLRRARRLFARAIEVPGGLRIQTIHSFCSSILRRFPLEARISPQFAEMDDRTAELLRAEVLDHLSEGPQSAIIDAIAKRVTDERLAKLAKEIIQRQHEFQPWRSRSEIAAYFDVPADMTAQKLCSDVFDASDRKTLADLRTLCQAGSKNDVKVADKLAELSADGDLTIADLALLEDIFLTKAAAKEPFSAKIGSVPTAATKAKSPALIVDVEDLMVRVQEARPLRLAVAALDRTMLLHDFAAHMIPAYQARKEQRGMLDFDDLIHKAKELLTDPVVAAWVLYKLDGGLDHILVDEAQDTSPTQWEVIRALASELAAGDGARAGANRTIFVVGDKKQSIYSFQGADPKQFDTMRDHFQAALGNTNSPLFSTELQHSFRSSHAILSLVDQTFTGELSEGLENTVRHRAFKTNLPGRVDLWPLIPKPEKPEPGEWFDPIDRKSDTAEDVQLARHIAAEIGRMIREDTIPTEENGQLVRRPIRAGDFLILVQRRKDLFREIIRACKAADLSIAGADRLTLTDQLAIKDILALLNFLALPEDDLSLAAALKSPLFKWTEQQLFTLAHGRGKRYLWQVLRERQDSHPQTFAVLDDLRAQADFLRPYDLIDRLLTRHGGRLALVHQLGSEAEDAIDAFLSQALAYERSTIPSLTGFLHWMEVEDIEVKRQIDAATDQIRVMTVHGSKGLEAPIVILPETQTREIQLRDEILLSDGVPIWKQPKDATPDSLAHVASNYEDVQRRERRRLLYVAMTRAEKWLIVCGAGEAKEGTEAWHDVISNAMSHVGAVETHGILRYQVNDWDGLPFATPAQPAQAPMSAPALGPLPPMPARPKTLAPSDLGGAKALPGEVDEDQEVALARGRLVHRLLEHLPLITPEDRFAVGERLLENDPDAGVLSNAARHVADVIALLNRSDLAPIFDAETLAEAELTAELPELNGACVHGTVDRLIIAKDTITCVDFKTNRVVPQKPEQVPEGVLRQMGAYLAALRQIWPNHRVVISILWTTNGTWMTLPDDLVMAALQRARGA